MRPTASSGAVTRLPVKVPANTIFALLMAALSELAHHHLASRRSSAGFCVCVFVRDLGAPYCMLTASLDISSPLQPSLQGGNQPLRYLRAS